MPSVFFQTFGCQMNVADSGALARALSRRGYKAAPSPEQADLIVVNTCSVRERAEERAKSRISEFAFIKRRRRARLWVIGCMAQRLGEQLKKEVPGIDAVIGAPELADAERVVDALLGAPSGELAAPAGVQGVSELVPVMRGCDNYCAYCIVPYVRGSEASIPANDIVGSVRQLAEKGVREITLLGQNVNSYRDKDVDFSELLRCVAAVDGIRRIRFTTSHPKDCTEKLITTMAETPKICRHLHLPVQSGSDRILSLMNRKYTIGYYRALLEMIKIRIPDADITTDLLVGFPSETEADVQETLSLVGDAGFTAAYMFAYSVREGTAAAAMHDTVSPHEKQERLGRVIEMQMSITRAAYQRAVGSECEMMVYSVHEKNGGKIVKGQDRGCKRLLLSCPDVPAGTILPVRAVRSSGMTLITERI
ncbi:MAG: tRNA (N6-isopentenyl adenosine(37)-C2)-methylthiotransferase MiaB [Chitinispirillaceae bacterium]|jgi:tRNA-2-methylthio-N6-dimethylallyladenosine synthase|nr:tRNA (N6-isopentenyl adenosine(37)-C2)-methylthiotransferase MiaB [Chitinispirillaceae bacterium]